MPSCISSSESSAAQVWLKTFGVVVALVVALLALDVSTPVAYGDLARIGRLDDRLFGWRAPQPAIDPQLLRSAALIEADVLVVGDSFSVGQGAQVVPVQLVWQSRLLLAGHRVATLHWADAEPLCKDFPKWLDEQGFRGRWILFQTVERDLQDRLKSRAACASRKRPISTEGYSRPAPPQSPPRSRFNWKAQLATGLTTAVNTFNARRAEGSVLVGAWGARGGTRLHLVDNGCRLFSHPICDRALFFADDELKPRFGSEMLAPMQEAASAYTGRHFVWIVVPNKSTVYLRADSPAEVGAELAARGLGPDLFGALRSLRLRTRDLYFPDDTHLSTRGSQLLGDIVLDWMEHRSDSVTSQ